MAYNNSMAEPVVDTTISNMFTAGPTVLSGTSAALLTATATTGKLKVVAIKACEYAAAGTTITLRFIPSGGSDAAASNLFTAVSIGSSTTLNLLEQLDGPIVLSAGDALKGLAGTASRANIVITYESENGVEA